MIPCTPKLKVSTLDKEEVHIELSVIQDDVQDVLTALVIPAGEIEYRGSDQWMWLPC